MKQLKETLFGILREPDGHIAPQPIGQIFVGDKTVARLEVKQGQDKSLRLILRPAGEFRLREYKIDGRSAQLWIADGDGSE